MKIEPIHISRALFDECLVDAINRSTGGMVKCAIAGVKGITETGETAELTNGLIVQLEPAKPVKLKAVGKLRLVSDNFGEEQG